MKSITKAAWERVMSKGCDIVNASGVEDDVLLEVHTNEMMDLLDELEEEFGVHSELLETRADFLDDPRERKNLYMRALAIARERRDDEQIESIHQSLKGLEEDVRYEKSLGKQ